MHLQFVKGRQKMLLPFTSRNVAAFTTKAEAELACREVAETPCGVCGIIRYRPEFASADGASESERTAALRATG